jgi:hypothetical protein
VTDLQAPMSVIESWIVEAPVPVCRASGVILLGSDDRSHDQASRRFKIGQQADR